MRGFESVHDFFCFFLFEGSSSQYESVARGVPRR